MKQHVLMGIAFSAMTLSVPALAQKEKEDKKVTQTIVVTRTGDLDDKTVIEIKGDKVTVNGKDASKTDNINVNVHKHSNVRAHARAGETVSFFSEDENRAMLGVVTDMSDKGARITKITEGSAAEKAGLKPGDLITRIGNKKISEADDITNSIRERKPGDKVDITYVRDGKEQKTNAELTKWKGVKVAIPSIRTPRIETTVDLENSITDLQGAFGQNFYYGRPKLGLSIQDTEDGKGVKILEVDESSHAAKAGLKKDDIITHIDNTEVNTTDEIKRLTMKGPQPQNYKFKVLRDGKTQELEVKIPKKLKTADL